MIYTYKVNTIDPTTNQELVKDVVLAVKIDGTAITPTVMISTVELFRYCKQYQVKVAKLPEISVPVIISNAVTDKLDCTAFFNALKNAVDSLNGDYSKLENVRNAYEAQLANVLHGDTEEAKFICSASLEFIQYLSRTTISNIANFSVDDIDTHYTDDTWRYIQSLDVAKVTATEYQETCEDKLFLRLPTMAQLSDETVSIFSLLPKRSEVCKPYDNVAAYTSLYKKPSSGIPKSMYPLIEGKVENNTLEIQENEKEFYDTLLQWIRNNIREVFGEAALEADPKNIVIDSSTQEYLNELIAQLYSWHWGHNPNVPVISPDEEEDPDASEVSNSGASSDYVFVVNKGEEFEPRIPATMLLQHFIQSAAMELGYEVYAQAIIKLCRWGTRKPTALYFEKYPYIFNLGDNKTVPYAGSISDYEIAVTPSGCNFAPNYAFMSNTRIVDRKFFNDREYNLSILAAPVGISFTGVYVNKKDSTKKLTIQRNISMVDVVRLLFENATEKSSDFHPQGMHVTSDGTIEVSSAIGIDSSKSAENLRMQYQNEKSTAITDPFYISNSLKNLYLELKSTDANREQNTFAILEEGLQTANLEKTLENFSFATLEELAQKRQDCLIIDKGQAIALNVFKQLYPIYLEVSKRILAYKDDKKTDPDLAAVLNFYKDAMIKYDYRDEGSFLATFESEKTFFETYKEFFPLEKETDAVVPEEDNTPTDTVEANSVETKTAEVGLKTATMFDTTKTSEVSNVKAETPVTTQPVEQNVVNKASSKEEPAKAMDTNVSVTEQNNFIYNPGIMSSVLAVSFNGKVIGYAARVALPEINKTKKVNILLSADYLERNPNTRVARFNTVDGSLPLEVLIAFQLKSLVKTQLHGTKNDSLFYESIDVMTYYTSLFEAAAAQSLNQNK